MSTKSTPPSEEEIAKQRELKKQKLLAAAFKEGGKKGQDLAGFADIGGVKYFHVALENCNGSWELTEAAMNGANTVVDEAAEERKGGALNIAKAFLSANEDRLCIYLHVPEELSEKVPINEWFDVLVKASGATVLEPPKNGFAKAELLHVPEVFPLKVRDSAIGLGFAYLRSKGVIPDEESSMEMEDEVEW